MEIELSAEYVKYATGKEPETIIDLSMELDEDLIDGYTNLESMPPEVDRNHLLYRGELHQNSLMFPYIMHDNKKKYLPEDGILISFEDGTVDIMSYEDVYGDEVTA